ncbi:MAG: hypothetical protein GWO24_17835, partial [Akkermansiaceae bacterium]|nr:hypothetical protein [Akkermansiaceae bacterium]
MRKTLPFTLVVLFSLSPLRGEEEDLILARTLTLKDCIMRAIEENPDLQSEQRNVLIGREEILRELAAFAWNLEATSLYEHREKPQNAREVASTNTPGVFEEDNWRSRMGFTRRFTTGTQV